MCSPVLVPSSEDTVHYEEDDHLTAESRWLHEGGATQRGNAWVDH